MRKAAGILGTLTSQWYQQQREREREGKRELEALQNETAEESPRLLCQLIYVAFWLGVTTELDTCWSPHDWTHLWTNWTLQGHLDTDDIQHTRMHRHTHTHMHAIPTHTRIVQDMHAHTYTHSYTVTVTLLRVMDQSRLKLSWILHGVWCRRRITIEKWRKWCYFRLQAFENPAFSFCCLSCCCW